MDKQTWLRVEQLFYQALELPQSQRDAFVCAACPHDKTLQHAVLQLLAHEGKTLQMPERLAAQARQAVALSQDLSGTELGHYRLLREIGRGGMGVVYLAERADKQFNKQVAVKLIVTTLVDQSQLLAFKTERQILADLEHAGISRLLDGGMTDEGMPYLVMEYVQGEPVDQYCTAYALSLTAKLQLFVKIAAIVAFAHQNMVVHCDLKPSNILITRQAEPKLLDFGVAHLFSRSNSADEQDYLPRLTLRYASPEQKRCQTVSTLSDVYSLGVILQQLLGSDIPADIDCILTQALQTEPAKRYSSVTAFSDDIKRFLGKYPVQARADTWWYRSKTFVRRNSVSSGLAAVFLLSVLVFSGAIWLQSQRVIIERDQARLQRDKAHAISTFVTQMFASVDPFVAQGHEPTVREVLDHSAQQLLQGSDHALVQHPEVEAAIRQVIGRSYFSLGLLPAALLHLEHALQLAQHHHFQQSELYFKIIKTLADVYQDQYKTDEVQALRYQALNLAERLFGQDDVITLGALSDLASAYHTAGDLEKAEQMWLRLYQTRLKLLGAEHADIVHSLSNLGIINHWLGSYDKAERFYLQCFAMAEKLLGKRHPRTLLCLSQLGSVYETSGRFTEAEPLIQQHIALATKVLGPKHPDTLRSQHNLADTFRGLGRLAEAELLFRQTLEQRTAVLGADNIETLQTQMKLARVLVMQQQFIAAEALLSDAYSKQQAQLGIGHPSALTVAQLLADTYLVQQKNQPALQLYQHILQQRSEKLGEHPDSVATLAGMAQAYFQQGQVAKANKVLQQANSLAVKYPQLKSMQLQQANLMLSP